MILVGLFDFVALSVVEAGRLIDGETSFDEFSSTGLEFEADVHRLAPL